MPLWALQHRLRVFVHRIRFPGQPLFNDSAVPTLINKTVLVSITVLDRAGSAASREAIEPDSEVEISVENNAIVIRPHRYASDDAARAAGRKVIRKRRRLLERLSR